MLTDPLLMQVLVADDCVGAGVAAKVAALQDGQVRCSLPSTSLPAAANAL